MCDLYNYNNLWWIFYYLHHFLNSIKKLFLIDGEHHVPLTEHSVMPDFAISAANIEKSTSL